MYKYSVSTTTAFKPLLALSGLYGGLSSDDTVVVHAFTRFVNSSFLPFYLNLKGTFIGWVDTFLTFAFLGFAGSIVPAGKYDMATRGSY